MKYHTSVHSTLVTDSFYNNLGLAHCLVENKTHLVESLRQNINRCALGEIVGKGSNTGTVVANWTGKRNVRFIAMRHGLTMIDTEKKKQKNHQTICNIILQPPQKNGQLIYSAEESNNRVPHSSFCGSFGNSYHKCTKPVPGIQWGKSTNFHRCLLLLSSSSSSSSSSLTCCHKEWVHSVVS